MQHVVATTQIPLIIHPPLTILISNPITKHCATLALVGEDVVRLCDAGFDPDVRPILVVVEVAMG